MSPTELRELLEQVRAGVVPVEAAAARLGEPAVAELGYATLDLHRKDRCGFPEVIFAEGKAPEWVEGAARRLAAAGQDCLVTRVNPAQAEHLAKQFPHADQDRLARTFWLPAPGERSAPAGRVCVVNIDAGFKAGYAAALVARRVEKAKARG